MLGREGVTGMDRMCTLGARKGERGGARNLGVLTLVPCVEGGRKESVGDGGGVDEWGADNHLKLGRNKLLSRGARNREGTRAPSSSSS